MPMNSGMSRLIVLGGAAVCSAGADAVHAGINAREEDGGLLFTEGGRPVLFYRRDAKTLHGHTRAHYIHPLYGLDGETLTEESPRDHPHHWGIFWAWHQLWIGSRRMGDPWVQEAAGWRVTRAEAIAAPDGSAVLGTAVEWTSPTWLDEDGNRTPIVLERTDIRIHPAEKAYRLIDFTIRLRTSVAGVRIGGAENQKEYGGFSVRIPMPDDLRFTGAAGRVQARGGPVDSSPWMDFSASFGAAGGGLSGLAVLCHPSTPGFPQRWILRAKGSMQNPVFPGREAIEVPVEKALVLRYRLVVHRGDADQVDLPGLHRQYEQEE